jgi:hypothetical protein
MTPNITAVMALAVVANSFTQVRYSVVATSEVLSCSDKRVGMQVFDVDEQVILRGHVCATVNDQCKAGVGLDPLDLLV